MPTYIPSPDRYDAMQYRRSGRSGIQLPAISLGLWYNFGDDRTIDSQRAILRRAFDRGVTHFDLANNYGPPYGSAEINFGRILHEDFSSLRDELIISTKAGWDMWPGPYGDLGSRKYLLASLDQSLKRMGLDYVDIFYHHHFDPTTPMEESLGALDSAVRQGKALYVGISSYSDERTLQAITILRDLGTPLLIHQPSYSLLNRWIEDKLLNVLDEQGVGCIAFSPLGQGLLTDRYANGVASDSRAAQEQLVVGLDRCSTTRTSRACAGWPRSPRSADRSCPSSPSPGRSETPSSPRCSLGASSVEQLDENLDSLNNLEFSAEELTRIDEFAVESGINIWSRPTSE